MTEWIVRRMEPRDLPAALKLTQAQRWSHRLEDWEFHFLLGRGWVVCGADGQPIGSALWWAYGREFGTIGLVVVDPQHQGKGLGRKLMETVLWDTGPRVMQLVATKAGLKLYQQCGFREHGGVVQRQGVPDQSVEAMPPLPGGVTLRAVSRDDIPALCALDAAAFGADRRELIGAVFDAGRQGICAEQGGKVIGFTLMRASGRGALMGPVVARHEALAIALVSHQLKSSSGFTRIDIPQEAAGLAGWLDGAGLVAVDHVTTMIRGEAPRRQSGVKNFALVSQAFS